MDLCFFLTRGFFDFSVKMDIIGVKRKMGELLVKHMKGLRLSTNTNAVIYFFSQEMLDITMHAHGILVC